MTVAFQRMFRILEQQNNNQVTPSRSKPYELSYRSKQKKIAKIKKTRQARMTRETKKGLIVTTQFMVLIIAILTLY